MRTGIRPTHIARYVDARHNLDKAWSGVAEATHGSVPDLSSAVERFDFAVLELESLSESLSKHIAKLHREAA